MTLDAPRALCPACRRPEVVCYCAFVTPLATRTRVVVLMHPRERDVAINTARIASLCLPQAELHVGVKWPNLQQILDAGPPAALLYPAPDAIDVEASPPVGTITLVVVDGTWWQARKVVRENPALAALPRYAFRPEAPSDYRIRREPHAHCVSTIEALAHVLGVLEGDRERFRAMLAPFRAMVDAQLSYAKRSCGARHGPHRRKRRPVVDPRTRIPTVFRERPSDVVCVYAEANAWPYDGSERAESPDELVHWVACRPATGETFEAIVAPRRPLCPATPFHVGIDEATLYAGMSLAQFFERWARFVRPTDVVAAWSHIPAALFARAGGTLPDARVDLRHAARVYSVAKVGAMDTFRTRLGLATPRPLAAGRAGERLACLVAIASFFLEASRASAREYASAAEATNT